MVYHAGNGVCPEPALLIFHPVLTGEHYTIYFVQRPTTVLDPAYAGMMVFWTKTMGQTQ
jgi:hypothetical protein